MNYLSHLKENPAKLTATGNLSRKAMGEISKFIPIPKHYLELGWRLNNQQDWPYLDQLNALAEVGRFTSKRKGYKYLSPRGKEYIGLMPTTQYGELFITYWENLNWEYLFPYGDDDPESPADILWRMKDNLLSIMRSYNKDTDGWINFFDFAEYIRKQFNLKLANYLGEDLPDRVRDCIVDVLLEPFFGFGMIEIQGEIFDHHRINSYSLKSFKLTKLGEKMFYILTVDAPSVTFFEKLFTLN